MDHSRNQSSMTENELQGLAVICPVKDGIKYLDRFISALTPLNCSIIFFDQLSTDGTTEYLQKLSQSTDNVFHYLNNATTWDSAQNVNALLRVAAKHNPEWILQLDVDETVHEVHRIPKLCAGAEEGTIYAFNRVNMSSNTSYWPGTLLVERLFRFKKEYTISQKGLHAGCIPDQISRVVNTGIMLLHWNMITEEDRKLRYDKFMEADPNCEQQGSYENLLTVPPFSLPL